MTSTVEVLNPGIAGIVVDAGRFGHQHQGFTPGGPLDEVGFFWGNALVGNDITSSCASLELIADTKFLFRDTVNCAITGPNLEVCLNDEPINPWASVTVKADDRLTVKSIKVGQRYYLSVSGGFDLPQLLGSSTTVVREQLGGIEGVGKLLAKGDSLPITHSQQNKATTRKRRISPPDYSLAQPIAVITGYQAEQLGRECIDQFFSQDFVLSAESNRMGYRLKGNPLPANYGQFYSEGLHTGAIQLPPNGQPIVMLADRQTLGGYPKIGAIARRDLHRFVQALPGEKIRFVPIDVYSARNQWRLRQMSWQKQIQKQQQENFEAQK